MLTREDLAALRAAVPDQPDAAPLLETLRARAAPLLARAPEIPRVKALLSRDGGFCPDDGAPLRFDPWSPDRHGCPRCGRNWSGERHHLHWARAQHLWLAERSAELALLAALTADQPAAARAGQLLAAYHELYFTLPNRDNVLGPSHLFFSTYLESLWLTSYLAGACLLRAAGLLDEARVAGVDRIAEEAAGLIGDFNEGLSNRQTWHATALTAIAVWFDDLELAETAVESRTGLLGHLADGFGEDGLWWEGENYHLFALRGLMQGIHWARALGFDLLEDAGVRSHFREALLGPTRSALPDFCYPARRDSRFGVSLAQPAALELWEAGRSWLGGDARLDSWLAALYANAPPLRNAEQSDSWLHDAGRTAPPPARYARHDLSWWALTTLTPLPAEAPAWQPESHLLSAQGLAVLRHADRYASLECGQEIGGHGHPDRLHLTLHAGGVHWLPDQGTGSYVHASLAWYRSALAHNAPLVDGRNAGGEDAWCEAFAQEGEWGWCRAAAGEVRRTLIAGPTYLVDILELDAGEQRELLLPWHLQGDWALDPPPPGRAEPAEFSHPFVSQPERLKPATESIAVLSCKGDGGATLRLHLSCPGAELIRAVAPGLPTEPRPAPFLLLRARGARFRWLAVLDFAAAGSPASVTGVKQAADLVEVETPSGPVRYRITPAGLTVDAAGRTRTLAGLRARPARLQPVFDPGPAAELGALAPRIAAAPALDGTLAGFDLSAPLELDAEHQYRRSEAPYDPEQFSARAWINWDGEALYLAVAVSKPELFFRPPDAAALLLDNEPEDIHSDGLQIYWRIDGHASGFLVVPGNADAIRARPIGAPAESAGSLHGSWKQTDDGYLVTLRLDDPAIAHLGPGARIAFDLLVNEMQPDRLRRAGQLVWSGAGGWIYLRGDRHDPSQFGSLELG